MSRPTPRRPASSRGGTPRPRKIAGQAGPARTEADVTAVEPDAVEPDAVDPAAVAGPEKVRAEKKPVPEKRATPKAASAASAGRSGPSVVLGEPERPGVLARPKTTRVLIATLGLVTVALVVQFALLLLDGDDEPTAAADGGAGDALSVPGDRPVVAAQLPVRDGVDAAAKAAQEIVAVDFKKYAEEVDAAADLMTARFEEEYRTTAGDIEEQFVAQETVVQANVVAQGVVRSSRTRLEALVFLNQVVARVRDGKPETVVTPFKVLVTMVHTDQGWFVDDLDTDDPQVQDKDN